MLIGGIRFNQDMYLAFAYDEETKTGQIMKEEIIEGETTVEVADFDLSGE